MAGKKDPSIYDDRTTIGSSDELDEYGVWVKSEPQDLSSTLPEIEDLPDMESPDSTEDLDLPDFSDFDPAGSDTALEDISLEDTPLEFEEIPENSDLPEGLEPAPIDQDGFTEVSMNDFLDSESSLGSLNSIDFGDLDSTVAEMEPENPPPKADVPSGITDSSGGADLSNQLLMKIADELSSIKRELSSLKSELALVRSDAGKTESADAKGGGFFDEEDDEKIALTGDELDNILNTANFTEESGSGEAVNDDLSLDGDSSDSTDTGFDEVDLSELDGAVKVEDELKNLNDDLDVSLDLSSDFPDFDEESPELDSLREEGALPITPAPEDTSYLEEDLLAEDISAGEQGEQIDLSEAVIDEPDLSSHITENPVSEPAIDNISIDMEMEEQSVSEASGGSEDFVFETEETMEIPVSEDPLIDDSTPPVEDSGFGFNEEPWVPPEEPEPAAAESSAAPETVDDFSDISFDIPGEDTPLPASVPAGTEAESDDGIPSNLKQELKTVLSYMDQLLESLPEDKIEEFAKSEYFDTYKKLFEELGLV
jgi:hypothetical protein